MGNRQSSRGTSAPKLLIVTHALVLGGGYGWHRAASASSVSLAAPTAAKEIPVTKPVERKPARVTSVAGAGPWNGRECRRAWYALKGSKIPPAEIASLRKLIIREWAARDLHSALVAWSDAESLNSTEVSNAIQRFFDGHEEEMLNWINAGDFGLDGSELLLALTGRINDRNPALMLKLMTKVPEEFQGRVMAELFGSPGPDQAAMDERIAGIADLPDERLRSLAWQAALKVMVNGNGFHGLLDRPEVPADARRAALDSFAEDLANAPLPAKALENFRKLSPQDQAAIGPAILTQAEKLSFARPSAVTNAITMLADSGQWELLAAKGPEAIEKFFKSAKPNPEAVSRWALQLPGRSETVGTFRSTVAARFLGDLGGSVEWVRSLPEGWHREQALAQLVMTANAQPKNAATRDAALGEITDPAILAELREWMRTKGAGK